jgi:lactoylglutathione lyase
MKVQQVVPLFGVADIERSVRFYVERLGFTMTNRWIDEGKLRWCSLQLDGAALMLQEFRGQPESKVGAAVSLNFICDDALANYREMIERGVDAKRPFVGNGMWAPGVADPDSYQLFFESTTDAPEESVYQEP